MADAEYILGTNEYVVVELKRGDLSSDFDSDGWTYELVLLEFGTVWDAGDEEGEGGSEWVDAVYELATDSRGATHHTVKALLPTLTEAAGRYTARVQLTAVDAETETPTILEAEGMVTVGL